MKSYKDKEYYSIDTTYHRKHWDFDDTVGVLETLILVIILFILGLYEN